jgi:hypothetical protein
MSDATTPTVPSISTSNRNIITGHNNHFGKYVKLNVGNHLFLTSFDTLTKEDTMFKAMFSGRMEVVQDSEGKNKDLSFIELNSNYRLGINRS